MPQRVTRRQAGMSHVIYLPKHRGYVCAGKQFWVSPALDFEATGRLRDPTDQLAVLANRRVFPAGSRYCANETAGSTGPC